MSTTNWSQSAGMTSLTEVDNISGFVDDAEASAVAAAASEAAAAASKLAAATSATQSASSASASATSASASDASKTAAETAETNAETAETNAETAEANAATAATTATSQAVISTTQAGIATTKAAEAASDAASAGTSEANAAVSASAAAGSATASANSAAAAAAALDNFDDRYLGPKSTEPTVDNDGDTLVSGALYFNSTSNAMQVYDGAGWIAASAAGVASMNLYEYTATAGQTTFTGSDDNGNSISYIQGNEIVVLNGIILDPSDYNSTSGTSIVLGVGAAVSDLLNVYAFKSFTVADTVSASAGGTFGGNVTVTGNITVTGTVDGRDVATDGTKLDGLNSADYATAAQGALADTATQPSDLGTAATTAASDYATAAQGAKADASVQATATTGQANLPSGTTAERTAGPIAGAMRFNSTDTSFEGYNGTEWGSIGGGAADGIFYENEQAVAADYTIVATKNAMTAGPITVNAGVTVTIETGGRWVVL